MCNDTHDYLSRRSFLHGSAALAAGAALLGSGAPRHPVRRLPLRSPLRPLDAAGNSAYSMAMHIHTSASEQSGSVEAHLYEAALNAVDVCWFTDHDGRMDARDYRKTVHFTSLTHEHPAPGEGGPWAWTVQESGPLRAARSGGGIVTKPCSPNDPVAGGALNVYAQSTGTAAASYGFWANSKPGGWSYHDNLTGQSLVIDILPGPGWSAGYLEMLIGTSLHEASAGRPAGIPYISYRFTPGTGKRSYSAQGNLGVVTVPLGSLSGWSTMTLTPGDDIAKLWPDLDHRDFALFWLQLNAVSTGDAVSGYFDYLRLERTRTGGEIFAQQKSIGADLASAYPSVAQQWGLEISSGKIHCNWFGPGVKVPTYANVARNERAYLRYLTGKVLPEVHAAGAIYSYNHPYGAQDGPLLPKARQDALLRQTATVMLPTAALGADMLEVGYQIRGFCDLAHHLGLWDVFSRNAVFLTGNGTTDDHFAINWLGHQGSNNWVTRAWAPGMAMADLQAALSAGRAWCGDLAVFGAPSSALDMLVDRSVPMGAASVSNVNSRSLALTVQGVPAGGSVTLLQGAVDYAGTADPTPDTAAIGSWTAAQLAASGGTVTTPVDTSSGSFVRAIVTASNGRTVVGAGNPVWLLRKAPPGGIPVPRQALGRVA